MKLKFISVIGSGAFAQCEDIAQYSTFEIIGRKSLESLASISNEKRPRSFLIEGFPESLEDYREFTKKTGVLPELVLCLVKPGEQVNIEPALLDFYETKGVLRKINPANLSSETLKIMLFPFIQDELLELSKELLRAIDDGDYETYEKLCDTGLTAFEPESHGQLLEGLPFHKFYFDMRKSEKFPQRVSTIAAPKVSLIAKDVAVVTYTRLMQAIGTPLAGYTDAYIETRVWKLTCTVDMSEWKHVHFHRSKAPTNPEFYKINL